jgi:hypothetical protein
MSTVNDLIDQINHLSGYRIPNSVNASGSNTAVSGTISTAGIYPGAVIKADQVLRIIEALDGTSTDTIIISGSLLTSGSNVLRGTTTLSGSLAVNFVSESQFLYVTGGLVKGTNVVPSSSFATSASYAITSSLPLLGIVTASAIASTVTFTKGDQTTFDIVISQSGSVESSSYSAYAENAGTASIATSASYAQTASFALNVPTQSVSSSYASTASYVELAQTASYFITSSVTNATSASYALSSSLAETASFVRTAQTASYVANAVSSSYALTASFALNVPTQSVSSSYAATASYVENAQTASFAFEALSSSFALSASYAVSASYEIITEVSSSYAETASYAFEAISSSFALTASYALNVPTESVSSSYAATASVAISSSYADSASISNIQYVTNSGNLALGQIQVLDYSDSVATTYINGLLTFVFGTPAVPSALVASISGFDTNRFNQVLDNYTVNSSWSNGGYTLISASLYEGSTLLTGIVDSGTSLSYNTTTSGSHTYRLAYTASSPLDNSIYIASTTTTGTVTKTNPNSPSISATPTIQLGAASSQFEQGATGSISFTSASGAGNGWVIVYTTSSVASPYAIVGSLTGSSSIPITATSFYSSSGVNGSDNSPALTTTSTTTTTYTKIRSLRSGATLTASYTQGELEILSNWDTTLGGNVGTIQKGTTTATGQTCIINWTGSLYQYIVYDSARPALTAINSSGFNVIGSFALTTVGSYKVYKTIDLQAGYGGTTATYTLI